MVGTFTRGGHAGSFNLFRVAILVFVCIMMAFIYYFGHAVHDSDVQNMEERLNIVRQRYTECQRQWSALRRAQWAKLDDTTQNEQLAALDHENSQLHKENWLLQTSNDQLRKKNNELEEDVQELRIKLADKDFVSDDKVAMRLLDLSQRATDSSSPTLMDMALKGDYLSKDQLIETLLSELDTQRTLASQISRQLTAALEKQSEQSRWNPRFLDQARQLAANVAVKANQELAAKDALVARMSSGAAGSATTPGAKPPAPQGGVRAPAAPAKPAPKKEEAPTLDIPDKSSLSKEGQKKPEVKPATVVASPQAEVAKLAQGSEKPATNPSSPSTNEGEKALEPKPAQMGGPDKSIDAVDQLIANAEKAELAKPQVVAPKGDFSNPAQPPLGLAQKPSSPPSDEAAPVAPRVVHESPDEDTKPNEVPAVKAVAAAPEIQKRENENDLDVKNGEEKEEKPALNAGDAQIVDEQQGLLNQEQNQANENANGGDGATVQGTNEGSPAVPPPPAAPPVQPENEGVDAVDAALQKAERDATRAREEGQVVQPPQLGQPAEEAPTEGGAGEAKDQTEDRKEDEQQRRLIRQAVIDEVINAAPGAEQAKIPDETLNEAQNAVEGQNNPAPTSAVDNLEIDEQDIKGAAPPPPPPQAEGGKDEGDNLDNDDGGLHPKDAPGVLLDRRQADELPAGDADELENENKPPPPARDFGIPLRRANDNALQQDTLDDVDNNNDNNNNEAPNLRPNPQINNGPNDGPQENEGLGDNTRNGEPVHLHQDQQQRNEDDGPNEVQ